MNTDSLLIEYIKIFGDKPTLIWGMTYDSVMYKELLKKAIETGEEITLKTLNDYMKKHEIQVDREINYFDPDEDTDYE